MSASVSGLADRDVAWSPEIAQLRSAVNVTLQQQMANLGFQSNYTPNDFVKAFGAGNQNQPGVDVSPAPQPQDFSPLSPIGGDKPSNAGKEAKKDDSGLGMIASAFIPAGISKLLHVAEAAEKLTEGAGDQQRNNKQFGDPSAALRTDGVPSYLVSKNRELERLAMETPKPTFVPSSAPKLKF